MRSAVSAKTMRHTTNSAHGPTVLMMASGSSQGISVKCVTGHLPSTHSLSKTGPSYPNNIQGVPGHGPVVKVEARHLVMLMSLSQGLRFHFEYGTATVLHFKLEHGAQHQPYPSPYQSGNQFTTQDTSERNVGHAIQSHPAAEAQPKSVPV